MIILYQRRKRNVNNKKKTNQKEQPLRIHKRNEKVRSIQKGGHHWWRDVTFPQNDNLIGRLFLEFESILMFEVVEGLRSKNVACDEWYSLRQATNNPVENPESIKMKRIIKKHREWIVMMMMMMRMMMMTMIWQGSSPFLSVTLIWWRPASVSTVVNFIFLQEKYSRKIFMHMHTVFLFFYFFVVVVAFWVFSMTLHTDREPSSWRA